MSTEDAAVVQFETDGGALGSVVISQVSAGPQEPALVRDRRRRRGAGLRPGAARGALGRPPGGRRRSSGATRTRCRPRPRATRTLPGGHPQGYQDCFDAFVADIYAGDRDRSTAAATGCRPSPTACAPARITEAVLRVGGERRVGRRRDAHEAVARMKLGLPHRLPARAQPRGRSRAWAGGARLRGARGRRLAATRRPPLHRAATSTADALRRRARPTACARLFERQRPRRCRRSPTTTTTCTPTRPSARRSTPTCAPCIDAAAALGGRTGRHVHRPRPGRSVAENLREAERVFPPLVDHAGERGVRLIIENCVMEGWHPDGYPGNLAYSPELWEWMFALGLYLNFDPSHLLWIGHRPGRRRSAPTSTASRTRRPRTPRRSRRSATATASSAAPSTARRTRGTSAGGATASRASARSTAAATSTRSTRAASTACCRSSTRTRCGAARPEQGRGRACGSPTATCGRLVVAMTHRSSRSASLVKEYPGRPGAPGRRLRRARAARCTACSARTAPASRR